MIKINYRAEALQAIHTGSDESYGTLKTLRREKVRLKNPVKIESKFGSDSERREAITTLLVSIYKAIDNSLKEKSYGFYEAFANKVIGATRVRTKYQFLTELCKACGVNILNDTTLLPLIDAFHDDELLQTIRDDHQYIMLMLRDRVQNGLQPVDYSGGTSFTKAFGWVPFIHGNSIRGLMRRLVMKDWADRIGIEAGAPIAKDIYHQLFTGGNISSSTGFEDIEKREQYIHLCPMIGLLGSAIGNMTISGNMMVGPLSPVCREKGTGEESFWETIGVQFNNRLDSSKTDRNFAIVSEGKERAADQMKYEYEVYNQGTIFDGDFALVSDDPVQVSAFWHALKTWKDFGYVAAMSSKGLGKIAVQIEIPEGATDLYVEHIENVKVEAFDFFMQTELA